MDMETRCSGDKYDQTHQAQELVTSIRMVKVSDDNEMIYEHEKNNIPNLLLYSDYPPDITTIQRNVCVARLNFAKSD